jgi:hypothetical protein
LIRRPRNPIDYLHKEFANLCNGDVPGTNFDKATKKQEEEKKKKK